MHRFRTGSFALGFGGALILLAYSAGKDWGVPGRAAAIAYAVLVTIFLVAQLAGFVWTQTHYVESVERLKLKVLEAEADAERDEA